MRTGARPRALRGSQPLSGVFSQEVPPALEFPPTFPSIPSHLSLHQPATSVVLFLWFEIRRDPVSEAAEDGIAELLTRFLPSVGAESPELFSRAAGPSDTRVSCVGRAVFPALDAARAALQSEGFAVRLGALAARGLEVSVTGGLYRRWADPIVREDPGLNTLPVIVGYGFPLPTARQVEAAAGQFPHDWSWAQSYLRGCEGFHCSVLYEAVDRQYAPFPYLSVSAWSGVGALQEAMATQDADQAHGYFGYTSSVGVATEPYDLA